MRGGSAQIVGPTKFDDGSIAAWLSKMKGMRTNCTHAVGYDTTAEPPLSDPTLRWTQTAFIGPQMHPYDRFFYNESLENGTNGAGYTVDKWLGDLNKRYGGIDQALIWPTYTNLGIDDRNTFDLIRSMPGGAAGLKVVVDQLHAKGVKVLWPYHPWDSGTRGQERNNVTDFLAMAHLLQDTGSDGFNGDTMQHIPKAFVDASYSIGYKAIAMQAEGGLPEWDLPYRTIGWAEGWLSGAVYVDKAKWLTKGLATTQWSSRWSGVGEGRTALKGKLPQIQICWFNGLGYETWENVWGTWNGLIERSAEAIRRVGMMLRFFGHRAENFFASPDWIPFTAEGAQMEQGVFVSAFPRGKETVYTFINWNENSDGTISKGVQLMPAAKAAHYYDCYNGVELTPDVKTGALAFDILANDFGCVVATPNATTIDHAAGACTLRAMHAGITGGAPSIPTTLGAFLGTMAVMTKKPLAEYDNYFHYLPQVMVNGNETTKIRPLHDNATDEVYISGGLYDFKATGIEDRPSPPMSGNDVQFPWEPYPRRAHEKTLQMPALYVDKYPVTNAKYAAYLQASKYVPKDRQNWLKHSFDFPAEGTGQPSGVKPGWEQKPVTYVSLLDAQAYCAHEGKRLPSVIEWQYFAQGGNSSLIYPWGADDNANFTPAVNSNWTNPGPEPVGAHPEGGSVDGIQDLVRSVWQMTSVFEDDHTRSVLLRGGSNYGPWRGSNCRWIENDDGTPQEQAPGCWATAMKTPVPGSKPHFGSHWYFAPAFELNTYNKYYIMGGSYDRAGTIGFRCVADAKDDCGTDQKLCVDFEPLVGGATVDLDAAAGTSAMASDWAHFTQMSGSVPVRMDHGATPRTKNNSLTIGFCAGGVEMGVVVPSANGTGFSWTHGEAAPGPATGTNDHGGVLIADGSDVGGVSIYAPHHKTPMTLTAYFGPSTGGTNGVVTATSSGFTKTLDIDIEPEGAIVSIAYDATASDLNVRVSNGGGSAPCAMAQLLSDGACIGAIAATNGADLSRCITGSDDTLLDWKHWGGIGKTGRAPEDWGLGDGPQGYQKTGLIQNATCSSGDNPCPLYEYADSAGTYSWTRGANEISGKGGVVSEFGTNGSFSVIARNGPSYTGTKSAVQRLKLYVGAKDTNAKLVVQSTEATKKVITTNVPKTDGTFNFVWTIDFIGDVMVRWGSDGDHDGGNLSWQAATLETVASGDKKSEGLVLQSLVWGS